MASEFEHDETDILTYPLSHGVQLSLWTSLYNQPGTPAYFWAQFTTDELPQIWYKCYQKNSPPPKQWKSFRTFTEVCSDVEQDDDSPQLGATEILDQGRYTLQTKVLYKGESYKPDELTFTVEPGGTVELNTSAASDTAIRAGLGEMIDFLKDSGDYSEQYLQDFKEEMQQAFSKHPCRELQEQLDGQENTPFDDSVDQLFHKFMQNKCSDDDLQVFAQSVQQDQVTALLNKVITIGGPQDYIEQYDDAQRFFAFIDFVSGIVISLGDPAIARLNEYEDSKVNTHYIHYIKQFANDQRFHAQIREQFPFLE